MSAPRSTDDVEPDSKLAEARAWGLDRADEVRDTIQTKPFLTVGLVSVASLALGLAIGFALPRD